MKATIILRQHLPSLLLSPAYMMGEVFLSVAVVRALPLLRIKSAAFVLWLPTMHILQRCPDCTTMQMSSACQDGISPPNNCTKLFQSGLRLRSVERNDMFAASGRFQHMSR